MVVVQAAGLLTCVLALSTVHFAVKLYGRSESWLLAEVSAGSSTVVINDR